MYNKNKIIETPLANNMISGRQLATRLFTLILSFVIIMTWVFTRYEKNERKDELYSNSEFAIWLVKEKINTMPKKFAVGRVVLSSIVPASAYDGSPQTKPEL
jgi:hypothetical protein